eukprot:CAMPEP_0119569278 /NCGR_PEP_ID=MMETSP1352-20130426/41174_1 /TAXON_ID=265584 /ORGANISM="Stauroneis constricta, Strain CCMP1120" /LENGTH=105 /DNA_ID=CAMNT_0007618807 /DNA_START=35 /DNA_END=348 /DNA_ORIENTATION=-
MTTTAMDPTNHVPEQGTADGGFRENEPISVMYSTDQIDPAIVASNIDSQAVVWIHHKKDNNDQCDKLLELVNSVQAAGADARIWLRPNDDRLQDSVGKGGGGGNG